MNPSSKHKSKGKNKNKNKSQSQSTNANPFGEFMDARSLQELPGANEPDLIESLNATLPSQPSTLHPERLSGMHQVEDFFGSTVADQLRTQDEETRKARLRVLEQNELTRLKSIVERWETELQHVFNLYQESILRNLLSSTKERIRILEELDLTGTDLSLLQELRSRVDELNRKGDRAKRLMRKNFQDVEKNMSSSSSSSSFTSFASFTPTELTPSISSSMKMMKSLGERSLHSVREAIEHPMTTFSNSLQHAMEFGDRWRTRLLSYQDLMGNLLGFFMVLVFGNLTWKERGRHLLQGFQDLFLFSINRWRDDLRELDRERALQERRRQFERDRLGTLGLFFFSLYSITIAFPLSLIRFFWFFGWTTWGFNLTKRVLVRSFDYLNPIVSSSQPFNDKVLHVFHDAKTNLEDRSAHLSQNVKSSIAKGTHMAMAPLETATEKYVRNHTVKDSLKKAFCAVDSILAETTSGGMTRSESEQEVPLISKKRGSGITSTGITGTASPVVGKR